jgi:hypothetical protein
MQASVEDMYTWFRALRGSNGLAAEVRTQLLTPHVRRPEPGVWYGYGWNIRPDSSGALLQVSHNGSDGFCAASFIWRPRDDMLLYLVGNSGEQTTFDAAIAAFRAAWQVVRAAAQGGRRQ